MERGRKGRQLKAAHTFLERPKGVEAMYRQGIGNMS